VYTIPHIIPYLPQYNIFATLYPMYHSITSFPQRIRLSQPATFCYSCSFSQRIASKSAIYQSMM